MKLTYIVELEDPTKRKENLLFQNADEVKINREEIVEMLDSGFKKLSSKHFDVKLPSAVTNQNIREVKSLYRNFKKSNSKKKAMDFNKNQPICFNNQNYNLLLGEGLIKFPLFDPETGKTTREAFPVKNTVRAKELDYHLMFGAEKGKGTLFYKNGKWYFAVSISFKQDYNIPGNRVMGIDLGLKQLAVVSVKDLTGEEINCRFYSGREAGFTRKKYRSVRRKLGKAKKLKAIKKLNDKEARWMKDQNHKISRSLINLAVQEGAGTIVMEDLKNIRRSVRAVKRADRNIHSWAFFELQQFIEYKAKLAGIEVIYKDPAYTSQRCSRCGGIKKSNRRGNLYKCICGNRVHADLNAARNIAEMFEANFKQSA